MIQITASVSQESINRCKAAIDRKIAEHIAKAGSKVYNTIVWGNLNVDFPYWSGAYIASWRYNYGKVDHSVAQQPTNTSGRPNVRHSRPRPTSILPNYSSPYTPLYISNSADHAYQVEFLGTPKHAGGWMVATHAVNMLKYGVVAN